MSLPTDNRLEKALRKKIRLAVKASPELKRSRNQARTGTAPQTAFSQFRFLMPLAVLGFMAGGFSPEIIAPSLVLWTFYLTLTRALTISNLLGEPAHLSLIYQLPLAGGRAFDLMRETALKPFLWIFADWVGYGLGRALLLGTGQAWVAGLLLAVAQVAVALATAVSLARWVSRLWLVWLHLGATILLIWGYLLAHINSLGSILKPFFSLIGRLAPAGWVLQAGNSEVAGDLTPICLLLTVSGGGFALASHVGDSLRDKLNLERIFGYESSGNETEEASIPGENVSEVSATPAETADGETDLVRQASSQALAEALSRPPGTTLAEQGRLEKLAVGMLTSRERVILDFLAPTTNPWGRGWMIGLLLALVAGALVQGGLDHLSYWLAVPFFFFTIPAFGGRWNGLGQVTAYQSVFSPYVFYPLGFWEISRVILKINGFRCLCALPLFPLADFLLRREGPYPGGLGLSFWLALTAMQPVWVVHLFSRSTNDTTVSNWAAVRGFSFVILFVVALGSFFTGTCGFLAAGHLLGVALCGTVTLALPLLTLMCYGWCFHRRWFDLISKPVSNS